MFHTFAKKLHISAKKNAGGLGGKAPRLPEKRKLQPWVQNHQKATIILRNLLSKSKKAPNHHNFSFLQLELLLTI